MSNPFDFDPFAPSPAVKKSSHSMAAMTTIPATTTSATTSTTSSISNEMAATTTTTTTIGSTGAIIANNPFDSFGSFLSPTTTSSNGGSSSNGILGLSSIPSPKQHPQPLRRPIQRIVPYSVTTQSSTLSTHANTTTTNTTTNNNHFLSNLETNWDPWLYHATTAESSSSSSRNANNHSNLVWTTNNGGNFMTYLIVQTNAACCFMHGDGKKKMNNNHNENEVREVLSMERVFQWKKSYGHSHPTSMGMMTNIHSSLSLTSEDSMTEDSGSAATTTTSVMEEYPANNHCTSDIQTNTKLSNTRGGGGGHSSMQRFLKSNLKKAQQSIERSMATIAIKADNSLGKKNPDQICVSLHYLTIMNNNHPMSNVSMCDAIGVVSGGGEIVDICISRTEWVDIPSSDSTTAATTGIGGGSGMGVLFSIPLCVPDLSFVETTATGSSDSTTTPSGIRLTLRLYLRSGAKLFKAVAAYREYCIGECHVHYSNIKQASYEKSNGGRTIHAPLTSGMIYDISSSSSGNNDNRAALHITSVPRMKFSSPCTYGWSLTDPISTPPSPLLMDKRSSSGSCHSNDDNWLNMFQLPLDAAYAFHLPRQEKITFLNNHANNMNNTPSPLLLANECAVESTLVLPLATACSHLFSLAASQSQVQTMKAAEALRRRETKLITLRPEDDEYRSKNIEVMELAALQDGCAFIEISIKALLLQKNHGTSSSFSMADIGFGSTGGEISSVKVNLSFQPPHCIFEELLGSGSCPLQYESSTNASANETGTLLLASSSSDGHSVCKESTMVRFCPRLFTATDASLLPGITTPGNDKHYIGNVRIEVTEVGCNNNGQVDNVWTSVGVNSCVEGLLELQDYLNQPHNDSHPRQILIPAFSNGRRIGCFSVLLSVKCNADPATITSTAMHNDDLVPSSSMGLLAIAGLTSLTEEWGSFIDSEVSSLRPLLLASPPPSAVEMRRRQIATMGNFIDSKFLLHQSVVKDRDAKSFGERHDRYNLSLQSCTTNKIEATIGSDMDIPLFQRRLPRPFRPSSSRDDELLTGLGFNVHVQSLSLNIFSPGRQMMQTAVIQSVTHGAPADHARGFFGQSSNLGEKDASKKQSEENSPQGGLRRLELKRLDIAKELNDNVSSLINAVGNYFKTRAHAASMRQHPENHASKPSRHVPPNLQAIVHYRTKAGECAKRLHSLTWDIAVRRLNCFSQALGIAVTSYMASLSDGGPAMTKGCASVWVRHGYLITFEGLLSAVGKELGMIEDASVAISMLRMVNVILVPDGSNTTNAIHRINVPHSPFIRWVSLINTTVKGPPIKTQYLLEIGLDPSYYQTRIPDPLKNGVAVRFFPILFQMGVDIRQWGVNAGRSVASQIKDRSKQRSVSELGDLDVDADENERSGSILDDGDNNNNDEDDEDTAYVSDNEILYVLNVEGYRKLNAYAHSVYPTTTGGTTVASTSSPVFDISEQQQYHQQAQTLPIHPLLTNLCDAVKSSAGKMEHSILDIAATTTQRFGGGSTVFCKSGKDRTAMQVTFKQAQFLQRYIDRENDTQLEDTPVSNKEVVAKSTLMRKYGIRIPICEKNTGEPKFAFNPLQRKFMPEMLRPEASLCTWSKPET